MLTLDEFARRMIGVPFRVHGRSFAGVDCWGLIWLAYREVYGIALPSYVGGYASVKPGPQLADFADGIRAEGWRQVARPEPGDAVLLLWDGYPVHVGLAVRRRAMLHVERGIETCVEPFTDLLWKDRIAGFYRHDARR